MKRISLVLGSMLAVVMLVSSGASAMDVKLGGKSVKAGEVISVEGTIEAGQDLFVVISSEKLFSAADALGPKEKKRLKDGKKGKNAFGSTAIPAIYYVVSSAPEKLATPKDSWKGQTKGIFAFPPFKYNVRVNKLKSWSDIDPALQAMLGTVNTEEQWKFLTFTHEKKFGINTVAKEAPVKAGNTRMVLILLWESSNRV